MIVVLPKQMYQGANWKVLKGLEHVGFKITEQDVVADKLQNLALCHHGVVAVS